MTFDRQDAKAYPQHISHILSFSWPPAFHL